jgi:hypothetical protein
MFWRAWWKAFRSYYRTCAHRSHRWRLPCFRGLTYDSYCFKHNGSCWYSCDPTDQERINGPR